MYVKTYPHLGTIDLRDPAVESSLSTSTTKNINIKTTSGSDDVIMTVDGKEFEIVSSLIMDEDGNIDKTKFKAVVEQELKGLNQLKKQLDNELQRESNNDVGVKTERRRQRGAELQIEVEQELKGLKVLKEELEQELKK